MKTAGHTLTVRTHAQKTLLKMELLGQLSDGRWENSRPHDHWEVWANAEILVGPNVGRNFYPIRDGYCFTEKSLLEIIGERMKVSVRLAHHYGLENAEILLNAIDENTGEWVGEPTYTGEYYDGIRAQLAKLLEEFTPQDVEHIATNDEAFTQKDLIRELRDLRKIFKNRG
jgi:hypothetical protein